MSDEFAVTFQKDSRQPIVSPYTVTAQKLSDWRGAAEYFVSAHRADDDERQGGCDADVITANVATVSKAFTIYIRSKQPRVRSFAAREVK